MEKSPVAASESLLDRWSVSRDLWPGGTLDFWQGRAAPLPAKVFWPASEAQVQQVLQRAAAKGIPVVPYGMGSGVCGGARGREGAWVVDTKRLNTIDPIDEEGWTVRVEAGVNGQQLEDHLNAHGFTLGHSPSSISCSSVGGWAAARSAGQFSSKYGVFEDMILGLTFVSPAKILQLGVHGAEESEGALPMVLGSEGTLGVVTSVTVRIWRTPQTRWLRGYRFRTVSAALDAMRQLMQQELWPSVVRLYDPVDTQVGGRTKPKSVESSRPSRRSFVRAWIKRALKAEPIYRRSLALPLALPGLINHIFDGMASGCLLVVGWEGRPAVVEAQVRAGREILNRNGEDLGAGPGERWFNSRHAVSYKLMPVFERGGFADTMEVAAAWSDLEHVYNAVRAAVQPHAVVLAHMSHVYPEGGSIYFSFAGRGERGVYEAVWSAAQQAALAHRATVTHHHGVGSLKSRWASEEVGAAVEGWHDCRAQLDPVGVMNPGRLFVAVPPKDAGPNPRLHEKDGLLRVPLESSMDERSDAAASLAMEVMTPWDVLPGPPRWLRNHWETGWTEVSGRVGARQVRLGRGPRSAAGPDLRPWLAANGGDQCTVPVVPCGDRWMGRGRCENPWKVAQGLLRGDLRPSVLTVQQGELIVGFRGAAAAELGAIAARWVPGGLVEMEYHAPPRVTAVERTSLSDNDVCGVTTHVALRRRQ